MKEGGLWEAYIYLAPGGLPPAVRTSFSRYARQYAKASGWRIYFMRVTKSYVVLRAASVSTESSDSSNLSK